MANGPEALPNIVLLMTDQQKASAVGCYGNSHVGSAFQDQMAREGVAFRHAYSCSAVCTPSRASLMTGVQPLVHQVTCVQHRAPWNLPQLAELLAAAGYYTAACGHHEPRRDLHRGWHTQIDQNAPGELYQTWREWAHAGRSDVAWSVETIDSPADRANSALLIDWMIRTLDVAAKSGAPFFLHLALNDPHPPYAVPKPYDKLIDPMSIDLPPSLEGADPPAWHAKLLSDCGSEKASEFDVRKVIACYYGMIGYANDQMQRLFDAVARRGLLENTWFIMTSDHGDFTGEHGAFCKCEALYECLLHVPLIIRPPDGFNAPRGRMYDGLVDLTDVFATILGLAGVEAPSYTQGKDLIGWIGEGAKVPLRDCVFAQVGDYHGNLNTTWPGGMPESGRHPGLVQGARTLEFSYTRDPDYGDEAYDLRSDPHELKNLLNRGRSAPAEVSQLRQRVDEWEEKCLKLREELAIVPGDRGYWDGLQR